MSAIAIALSSELFPDPLLPVKTVQPANSPPPLSRSNSRDLKPRIFFNEILLMYTDGLFSRKKLLDGILHDSAMLLKEKPYGEILEEEEMDARVARSLRA